MKIEIRTFMALTVFFAVVGTAYGLWTSGMQGTWEPVGTAALLLLGGLNGMIGAYLAITAARIDERPEDDPHAVIDEGAGDQGVFAPWSWWPLVLGAGAAISFLGLAVGWWVFYVGAAFSMIALVGWVMEFSRGQHAH